MGMVDWELVKINRSFVPMGLLVLYNELSDAIANNNSIIFT